MRLSKVRVYKTPDDRWHWQHSAVEIEDNCDTGFDTRADAIQSAYYFNNPEEVYFEIEPA